MSGFEVAGLVLGAIPLLISGLEHYAEGVAVMKNMKQYDSVFADINSSFAVSIGIYTESCYNLLAPLSLPDAQMKTLLMEEDGEKMQKAWKDIDLQQNLTKRLGPHCKTYLSFVVNPPWVSKDGTVDENARNRFFSSAWVRIRGGFESNKCALLLQEIDRDISKIAQLTSLTAQVEPLRLIRKRRMKARVWANIRDSAQSLSELLCLRWPSLCSCQYSHRANMLLKAQGDDDADVDDENEQSHFELLLVFDQVAASAPPVPCRWQDVEIESSGLAQTA
ncbi:uncharacterized protein A1O5_06178 [Cladophialophora psammophila CBS 110553]|uniref:Fungal N-terminal domain-containing protein n=1 Tax=Cladophialophora psammophila CBS 110553 TaxID=1182543 RepID=W9XLE0_9EURO|nr:uncharacterized protein A1O5_06178 [Cladophialophora psammophila CBS 110553]EXJ71184.1 hypothetical protein A1O5_06178 [Cladophialophora psammophila CBS 110553]